MEKEIKEITMEQFLHQTYLFVYTQITDMYNLVNSVDDLNEDYVLEIQKRIPLLLHSIQNCVTYSERISSVAKSVTEDNE